jgi:beta-phosphoglucomutase
MTELVVNNLKSTLLDMDGIVVDSMKHHAEVWKHVLYAYGLDVELLDIFIREGMSGVESVKDIYKEKGKPIPEEEIFSEMLSKKHSLFEDRKISLFPVAIDIIKFLKSKNIKIGLVTGSMKRTITHLIPNDIFSYFDIIVSDDDVKKGKPDPEPYRAGLKKIGGTSGSTLVIENAPLGIKSAKSAGLVCYAVKTTLGDEYLSEADKIFQDHTELLKFFKEKL